MRDVCAQIHTQREIEIMWTDGITEFFGTFQFLFFEPLFEQILAVLCEDRSGKFKRLMTVQGTLVEENAKILKNRRELTRLHRNMLESFDGIWSAKNSLSLLISFEGTYPWGVCSDFSCLTVILRSKQLTELLQIQIIRSREICATRKFDSQSGITEGIENVRDDVLFRDTDTKDLTFTIDANDSTRGFVICSDEDCLAGNAVHVNANACFEIVKVNESVFCDEEDDAVTSGNLHCDGEIIGCLGREEDIDGFLLEGRIVGIMINFDDMQLTKSATSQMINTFAPVAFLTANVKSFVLDGAPSN